MKNTKFYNLYIFISTFMRNIIDVYSVIYLYQKYNNIKTVILIYTIIYFLGSFISKYSITIGNRIGYKYILILSTIFTSFSFVLIHKNTNIYIISICLSLSTFTYHPIRHYYGINTLKKTTQIGNTLIFTYLATLISSYLVIINAKIIYLMLISLVSIIPTLFIKNEKIKGKNNYQKIYFQKYKFFIFDQFKIIFLLLEPLYLYLISKKISYVGVFNIILTIASIICIYIITKNNNFKKVYKYINIIFTIILFLKLTINNQTFLLILAFFEGIGVKINELVSTINLYSNNKNSAGYIITSEEIFCFTRCIILSVLYLLNIKLIIGLYILIPGIFILSFQYQDKKEY